MAKKNSNTAATDNKPISSLHDFKGRRRGVFELPSGMVVKMKNPGGLQAFIANGTIPNSLLGVVQKALNGTKIDAAAAAKDLSQDMNSIGEMVKLLDIVASQAIIEPECRVAPDQADLDRHNLLNPQDQLADPDDLRDDEKYLYTDDIDELDKQFIMQWVTGGTRDLETFLRQHEASVAAVSAVESADGSTEQPAGAETA